MLGKLLAELIKELAEQGNPPPPRRKLPPGAPANRSRIPPRTATGNRPRSLEDLGEVGPPGAGESPRRAGSGTPGARRNRPSSNAPQRGDAASERHRQRSSNQVPTADETIVVGIPVSESVEEHVARHLDNSSIAEHTSHLGESVAREQQQLAEHVNQSLGKGPRGNLGRGAAGEIVDARLLEPLTVAEQIARALSSPQQIRTAFILGEIMKRPEF